MEHPNILEGQLKLLLECKICFEEKSRQKMLPCQHTLCLDCLNNLQVDGSKYKCPICQKEMLVPNEGFDALQESLIIKQIAALARSQPKEPATEGSGETEAKDKEANPIDGDSRQQALISLKKDLESVISKGTEKLDELTKSIKDEDQLNENIKSEIGKLLVKIKAELDATAESKISAVDAVSSAKKDKWKKAFDELKSLKNDTEKSLQTLSQDEVTQDMMDKAREEFQKMDDQLSSSGSGQRRLKVGDSVRLKLDVDNLTKEFLLTPQNHLSIGYIVTIDNPDNCAVVFPENSRWTGKPALLEHSDTKHKLPEPGDMVRVKRTVEKPFFDWGSVKQSSVGYLSELKNRGPPQGREVEVDFDEDHDWKCLMDELEKVEPPPLKVGEKVWIRKEVMEPARGWAGIKPVSVGLLVYVNGEDVEVDFPECKGWKGLLSEIERSRRVIVGDSVKVKESVKEPKFSWGGVTHNQTGKVIKIMNSSEHGIVCKIDFTDRVGPWTCLMEEIEIVKRLTFKDTKVRRRSGPDERCATQ